MSFNRLHNALESLAKELNAGVQLSDPRTIIQNYPEFSDLAQDAELERHFTRFSESVSIPKAVEALRLLINLKQRWNATHDGKLLVGRYRFDPLKRIRPIHDQPASGLRGEAAEIASYSPFAAFSSYQVEGWAKVARILRDRDGIVITAPTGAGKTEVFMLPLVQHITNARARGEDERFILIYPRVALLKDQLSRALLYSYHASLRGQEVPVGFQFSGVSRSDLQTLNYGRGKVFDDDRYFLPVDTCPVCSKGRLRLASKVPSDRGRLQRLQCDECKKHFPITMSQDGHQYVKTPILIMTAESLDRFYLIPRLESCLTGLSGIIIDEAHLYESLYGVHIYHVLRKVEALCGRSIAKIASSATIGDPVAFAGKFFYGRDDIPVEHHHFDPRRYLSETSGLECFITLPCQNDAVSTAPLLIQGTMALGHGILTENELQIAFIDSIDGSTRFSEQIDDAESRGGLWSWRTVQRQIQYVNDVCPRSNPAICSVYNCGECWRGVLGGKDCYRDIPALRERELRVESINSRTGSDLHDIDVAVATPTLEVGVDDNRIKAVVQYGPPRSIAGLIQRRGRAARSKNDIAFNLMLLGNGPSDNFALFRRQRILEGSYNIALNPANPILREMHERLERERTRFGQCVARYGRYGHQIKGTLAWILDHFESCPNLRNRDNSFFLELRQRLLNYRNDDLEAVQNILRHWAKEGIAITQPVLELRRHLQVLSEDFPSQLQSEVAKARFEVERILDGDGDLDRFDLVLRTIFDELNRQIWEVEPQTRQEYENLKQRIITLRDAIIGNVVQGSLPEHERLHSFFLELSEWLRPSDRQQCFALRTPPDDIKAILRSLYYLHNNLEAGHPCHGTCPASIDVLIPSTYFMTIKPIRYELRYSNRPDYSTYEVEPVSSLGNLFYPYRLSYLYYGLNSLTMLDTEHNPTWIQGNRVEVELPLIGIEVDQAVRPQQIPVRAISTDDGGRQVIKLCRGCYQVHSLTRRRPCCPGHGLIPVRLHSAPLIDASFEPHLPACEPVSVYFSTASGQGITTVEGSDVVASRYRLDHDSGAWMPILQAEDIEFKARYRRPLRYSVNGRGVGWKLGDLVADIVGQTDLQVVLGPDQLLTAERVLLTAASLLKRIVSAVAGVRTDVLQSASTVDGQVWVWETYEGGAGITEVFAETLREDPLKIYQEMLRVILCPVGLAESVYTGHIDLMALPADLEHRYALSSENKTLQVIISDVTAEHGRIVAQYEAGEKPEMTCYANDGCPVCLHDEQVRRAPDQLPSRRIAEVLLEKFVHILDRQTFEERVADSSVPGALPRLLRMDNGRYYVLVL